MSDPTQYVIVSINHTQRHDEHICFWGKDWRGYTPVIGEYLGTYGIDDAQSLNDGLCTMAVPRDSINALLSPEPYYKLGEKACRWFDQRGPVVRNTKANWTALIESRLIPLKPDAYPLKPMYRRKQFRSFALPGATT